MIAVRRIEKAVAAWKASQVGRPRVEIRTIEETMRAASEANATEEARLAAAVTKLLDALEEGARAIEDGAELHSVRSVFKTWTSCTVGYSALAEIDDCERAYDLVISVVDDVLGEAERRRDTAAAEMRQGER